MKFIKSKKHIAYDLKENGLRLSIHGIVGIEGKLYLTCHTLWLEQVDLNTNDFEEAVSTSKRIVKQAVDRIYSYAYDFINDDKYEITKY